MSEHQTASIHGFLSHGERPKIAREAIFVKSGWQEKPCWQLTLFDVFGTLLPAKSNQRKTKRARFEGLLTALHASPPRVDPPVRRFSMWAF